MALVIALTAWCPVGPVLAQGTETYSYRVTQSLLGNIGSFTNVVEHQGDETIVRTQLRVDARFLFFGIKKEEADRTARWRSGKLVSFDSSTITDDEYTLKVHGESHGDKFLISTNGAVPVAAPADIYPSNPWSKNLLKAQWVMAENTGLAEPARVTGGDRVVVPNGQGNSVNATRWSVDSENVHATVWFDDLGVAVKFAALIAGREIVFTLER
jgi:hypothetical protein